MRDRLVQRYLTTQESYREIARSEGVDSSTLRGWVNAAQAAAMSKQQPAAAPVDERSPSEKLRLLLAARSLPDDQLGEFLRREGVREGDLERWEQDALSGIAATPLASTSRKDRDADNRIRKLEARLREADALLDLQKKVQALWGGVADDTTDK
jgi:transposase-like protein